MLKKLINIVLTLLVFIYIIFEELIWESIAKPIYDYFHSLKILQKLQTYIEKLHRVIILIIFLLMFAQVELLGVVAAIMLAQGKAYTAVAMYVGKIPIGVFTFWMFKISREKLMTFGRFKSSYDYIMNIIDKIKDSDIYKNIKIKTNELRVNIKKLNLKYFGNRSLFKERISRIYSRIKGIFR